MPQLLVVSNGHGEDLISLRVLEALHSIHPWLSLKALPLVGEGKAFDKAVAEGWLKVLGAARNLPSGGFSNQSLRGLVSDLAAGLIGTTWRQWKSVRFAAKEGHHVLAVGDLLPLFFAWSSGAHFGFIGTPKSDYTWRSGPGHALSDLYHFWKGSEWDPWEWSLLRSARCKMVAVRDPLTARGLRRHGVSARAPGNPMMDGLDVTPTPESLAGFRRLILLCGSRMPEASRNFECLLDVIGRLNFETPLAVFIPLSSQPSVDQLAPSLISAGFSPSDFDDHGLEAQACWVKDKNFLFLAQGKFARWASWAEIGLANAGTATEQLVGLGVPALSLPGEGPQFKMGFARRQSRLLGGAVTPCTTKGLMARALKRLLADQSLRTRLSILGMRRMGASGASAALAGLISQLLLSCETEH
ncbi:lipid-A-disaccharide synthase-related protein [Prochlorococcus sp. MIT 1300]|uniref:lipid-A-disaccharide synthase-related protein n=1 Tax=Prochlorococcus sp. MIT 1300 TaxID=3096218 RepID=UPI002A7521DB|nr:lipid-A-disaccharide synthase-related protein [Prochlorococcus sp. MIT 1300]